MTDPITFGAAYDEAGVGGVSFPELGIALWFKDVAAPVPPAQEQNITPAVFRTVPEEGGIAYAAATAPAGFQVRIVYEGVWDVVFVDAFDDVALPTPYCALVLELYEDDGETLAWEVGTSPYHSRPYLCLPDNYGAQEIDIVAGAATIGQVEVTVIDKAQIPGDQDSGWLTERLSSGGVPVIRGRRCKLTRYISPELGYVVIADGPADTPRMDDSYAAYKWVIKDVRETERKIRAFTRASTWMLPMGAEQGWGYYLDEFAADQWLVSPRAPLTGTYTEDEGVWGVVVLDDYWQAAFTSNHYPTTDKVLSRDVELADAVNDLDVSEVERVSAGSGGGYGQLGYHTWPNIELLWRAAGSSDPWTVVYPEGMSYLSGSWTPHGLIYWAGEGNYGPMNGGAELLDGTLITAAFKVVMRQPGRDQLVWPPTALQDGDFPTEGQSIDFAVRYVGQPTPAVPTYVEYDDDGVTRMTAGRLLQKLYDGEYSDRDPFTGDVVPTGIRYDEPALLAMDTPVRLRLTEVVEDLRDWAEKKVYAPTGWVPSFNNDLAISPSSQETPSTFDGLPALTNVNVEPVPSWNAGETIVNVLEFAYERWYDAGLGVGDTASAVDNLQKRDIVYEFRSATSVTRKEYKVSFEGDAFAAIGDSQGAGIGPEVGEELAADRRLYVFDRYNNGAQTIEIPVRRSLSTSVIRPGAWVVVNLSWLPDYLLQRRGAAWGGQIVAIHDVDCAWRVFLIEEAVPLVVS